MLPPLLAQVLPKMLYGGTLVVSHCPCTKFLAVTLSCRNSFSPISYVDDAVWIAYWRWVPSAWLPVWLTLKRCIWVTISLWGTTPPGYVTCLHSLCARTKLAHCSHKRTHQTHVYRHRLAKLSRRLCLLQKLQVYWSHHSVVVSALNIGVHVGI